MRVSILLGMLFLSPPIFAQDGGSDPNETWNNGNFGEPESWFTSNTSTILKYGIVTVSEVPGITGSGVLISTFIHGQDTVRSFISNTKGIAKKGQGGVPFHEKVVGMHGYFGYALLDDDTAKLMVVFKKNDSIVSITNYKIKGNGTQTALTPFTFPITLDVVPDTVIIEATLSSFKDKLWRHEGSYLALDSLSFIGNEKMIPIANGNFEKWVLHRKN